MSAAVNHIFQNIRDQQKTLAGTTITGRTKNKFENGWLGGCGSTSQFQGVNQTVPILPFRSNYDLDDRIESSNGSRTGTPLQASWERSYAFAPGRGLDALQTRITHTLRGAGMDDGITGVAAPLINAGQDRFETGPIAPLRTYQGAQNVSTQAPYVATGGEAAEATQKGVYVARSKKDIKSFEATKGFAAGTMTAAGKKIPAMRG